MSSRIIKKKQKQKPLAMIEPLPCDEPVKNMNRLHQRQNIIHELDLIKARVDQVLYIVQLRIWQYTHFDDCIACYTCTVVR